MTPKKGWAIVDKRGDMWVVEPDCGRNWIWAKWRQLQQHSTYTTKDWRREGYRAVQIVIYPRIP